MTITATAHPEGTPPYNSVAVSITTGLVMSSVAVYRNDPDGTRSLLRTQPAAGFDSRTVTDYECPYEEAVTYDWTATYTDPTAYVDVFDETWASAAAWSGNANWNVSAGKVRNNSTSSPSLSRSVAAGKQRVTISSMNIASGSAGGDIFLLNEASGFVLLRLSSANVLTVTISGFGATVTAIDPSQPIVVDFLTSSVTVTGVGGSVTVPANWNLTMVKLQLLGAVPANAFRVGEIKVQTYGSDASIAQTSSSVTLSPDDAWLIHPGSPGLSVPLSNTDQAVSGIASVAPVVNESNTTVHNILGSATPVPTTTGPRGDDKTGLTVWTNTTAERAALRALLASDIPILIQIPPSWETDFNCGFYQVGNVNETRDSDQIRFSASSRTHELPLIKVQSPVVDVENSGWSYAAAAAEFASYTALAASFATYADLASNTRT